MSEPVGNGPRVPENIVGNSLKGRVEQQEQPKVEPEKLEKMVTGAVSTRKTPWWKRFGRGLIADDATSIGDYLMTDVLQPALRNLIHDTVMGGLDRGLYGASRGIRARGSVGEPRVGLRTRYDQPGEPRKMLSREERATHNFDQVVLDSFEEASTVIGRMLDQIERYRSVSVADLYDLVGVTGSFADRRWGWTNLDTADVRQVRGGYLLDLPRTEPLR